MKKYGETVLYYLEPDESYTDTGSEPAESENASMLAICPGSFDPIHPWTPGDYCVVPLRSLMM